MKATRCIKGGEQIFNDYGPLPRSDLLRMYGYVTENYARYDVVELSHDLLLETAGIKHNKPNASWLKKEEQLEELGIIDDGYAVPRPSPAAERLEDAVPGQLHMILRALSDDNIKKSTEAITIQEAALLQSALTKRLSEYGTSLQSDKDTLESMGNSPVPAGCLVNRYRMALQVRFGEKEILHQLLGLCQSHIATQTDQISQISTKRQRCDDPDSQTSKAARKNKR
jgi:N-lysine methyltransferase SETD6